MRTDLRDGDLLRSVLDQQFDRRVGDVSSLLFETWSSLLPTIRNHNPTGQTALLHHCELRLSRKHFHNQGIPFAILSEIQPKNERRQNILLWSLVVLPTAARYLPRYISKENTFRRCSIILLASSASIFSVSVSM